MTGNRLIKNGCMVWAIDESFLTNRLWPLLPPPSLLLRTIAVSFLATAPLVSQQPHSKMSTEDRDGDSDSDEDFCLFGMNGPIIVCEEDEVQAPLSSAHDEGLSLLQRLELSFLRKDVRAVRRMLEQEQLVAVQEQTILMALSLLEGHFVPLVTSRDHQGASDAGWRALQVVLLGWAHFSLFCQANYTGPELQRDDVKRLSQATGIVLATAISASMIEHKTEQITDSNLGQPVPQYGAASSSTEVVDIDMSGLKNKKVLQILECDGNYAFPLCELPLLLVVARSLLLAVASPLRAGWQAGIVLTSSGEVEAARNDDHFDVNVIKAVRALCSRQWLSSRALVIHLRLLQNQSYSENATLFKEMQDLFDEAEVEIAAVIHKQPQSSTPLSEEEEKKAELMSENGIVPENSQLLPLLHLEKGLGQHFFDFADKGKSLFQKAIQGLGLKVKLTAAMGKRTKHQIHDHAQLLLVAKSNLLPNTSDYNLTQALRDADSALEKCFGGKKEKATEVISNEWEHAEWELGTRIITKCDELNGAEAVIRDVKLDSADGGAAENILLEEGVKFTAPLSVSGSTDAITHLLDARHNVLHPVEQAVLLALCLDVSNSNPTGEQLTIEEMFPYLQTVINLHHSHQYLLETSEKVRKKNEMLRFHSMGNEVDTVEFQYTGEAVGRCLNWMVYSTTLLERSFLEFEKRRTMDRALMQIQALLDQHTTRLTVFHTSRQAVEEAAPAHVRLQLLPCLAYPSLYEVKRDLAQRYLRCQIFNSALNLFTELEMWDEVVTCYQLLQKPHRAEMLVRERLAQGEETPYMVCALADLTASEELYERSWVLSGKRYGRAKRTVARMCFDQGRYQACCDHLDEALVVQPLVAASWYLKGIASMRLENYSGAMQAFTRCVQQDMEVAEAWGNLAAIHMHCKRFDRAYECLIEARKHRSREWRLTENLLTVCIETGRYSESLEYMRQLLELRHQKSNAIDKATVTNNSSNVNTTQEHPTPVHLPDLRRLCVVVALRTLKFVRALDAAENEEGQVNEVKGEDIVLPRLTTELEAFLLKILNVMHIDTIYFEVLVMYHDLIYTGGANLELEEKQDDKSLASSGNGNLEDQLQKASERTQTPSGARLGAAEAWARRRSKDAIRNFRLKQFRVLLNQHGWEKEEKRVKELFRVLEIVVGCVTEDSKLLRKTDFYSLISMIKTAHSRLRTFYEDSRQLEGATEEEKRGELAQLHTYMASCAELEANCEK